MNNSFHVTSLNLNTNFKIVKTRHNIFQIGDIKINSYILNIISLGLNYIPNFKKIDLFYIHYNFYISLNRLNTNSFYKLKTKNTFNLSKDLEKENSIKVSDFLSKEFPIKTKHLYSLNFLNNFRKEFLINFLSFFKQNTNSLFTNIKSIKNTLTFLKNNKITLTTADKNIGIILIDTNLYNNLCIEHLINDNSYEKIVFNPQFLIYNKAKKIISDLNLTGHISNSLCKTILSNLKFKKLASFRILIKLHKTNKFGIRPLINCSNTTLSIISKILDFYFKPIVKEHFSFIKDSQNLIQLTKNISYDNKEKLYSADFESLYSNIPLDKSINIIMEIVSPFFKNDISSHAIFKFLQLVLKNNYFSFKHNNSHTFFLQIKGIAMGTSCGPSVANLYLTFFELKYSIFLKNSLYFRFIDDIIYTDSNNFLTHKFPEIFPDLNLNTVTSSKVQFLDLNISFNIDRTLNFDLFIKPTFTGSYLNINSNHPNHIFRGIIISLISRIRRNCTDDSNFYLHSSNLLRYLLKKGFSSKPIINIIRSFSMKDRTVLIDYKNRTINKFSNSLFYVTPFMKNFNIDYRFINNLWIKSLPLNSNLSDFKLKILYKTTPNLNSYLISMIKIPFKEESFTSCKYFCNICDLAITDQFLFNFNNVNIYLPHATTCSSSNIIYAIHCIKCNLSYIGQSSRSALVRINEHIKKIIKYKKMNCKEGKYNDSEILYNHFKDSEHNILSHFRFQIICHNIVNYRLRLETDLMYIFNTVFPSGLNKQSMDFNNNFETYNFDY